MVTGYSMPLNKNSAIHSCDNTTMVGFVSNRAAVLSSKANANDDLIRVAA